jgi:hypothetical protein
VLIAPFLAEGITPSSLELMVAIRGEAVNRGYSRFALTLLNEQVSEKNSSRKLAEQAKLRLPTPRYRIGMRVYGYGFPRIISIGSPVSEKPVCRKLSCRELGLSEAWFLRITLLGNRVNKDYGRCL